MLARMGSLFVRVVLELEFDEETEWYANKDAVGTLVDVVLSSDVGGIFTHAGAEYDERPVKDAAAVRKALVTGKAGAFSAIDAPELDASTSHVLFRSDGTSLRFALRVGGAALACRRSTVLDTLDGIAQGLIKALRKRGGVSSGMIYIGDDDAEIAYPRPRPPVTSDFGPMTQLVQYLDIRYHNDPKYGGTHPAIVNALAKAPVPAGVERDERDQLVTLRWITSLADEVAVGEALGRFESWLTGLIPVEPAPGYNALGDREDSPSERAKKSPFTFFDPDENVAYKAIMVSPDGDVDDEVWAEQLEALEAGRRNKLRVRLIVPLRALALQLRARARSAGFDAVLYPDDRKRLWNPDPPGPWIEDIKPTPTSEGESAQRGRKKT
jgi:hypothetical protein